jgi:hypothetical protein
MLGNSWGAAQLAASQEGLSSVSEWVSIHVCIYMVYVLSSVCSRYPFHLKTFRRMGQTLDWNICNFRLVRCVHSWGFLTKVSHTPSTLPADGLVRPAGFLAHRQPLWWNFLFYSRIVLSVGGSVWYLAWNLRCTVKTDAVLANSKTQNAFLSPVLAVFRHDCPLAVKSTSRHGIYYPNKLGKIHYLLIAPFCSIFLGCSLSTLEIQEKFMNYPVFKLTAP